MRLTGRAPLVIVAVSAAALLLGWQIFTIGVADFYALSRPGVALAWDRGHTEALIELVERRALGASTAAEKDEIARLAKSAIVGDPLQAAPLRILALVAEGEGDLEAAKSLMNMAAARSLRDVRSQIWLADYHLLNGDYAVAVDNIDALLRVWLNAGPSIFPVLAELTTEPESGDAVIAVLEKNPPWRAKFLARLPNIHQRPVQLAEFYARLAAGPAPLTTDELRPYLQAIIDQGEPKRAQAVLVKLLPPENQRMAGDIYNGGFEHPVSGLPFDWKIDNVRGADAELAPSGNGGRALRVEFYGARVPYRHVSQLLLLDPGSYRLAGDVEANLENERGLQWTISCAGGAKERLGETERIRGRLGWSAFETSFDVPADDKCQAQLLRLELAARVPAEQEASGEIWFDNLRVDRVTDGNESD